MTRDGPAPHRPLRPSAMRIDPQRCAHGGLCRVLAPEIGDGADVPVTPATLAAMAECPTGALAWREDGAGPDDAP